MKIKVLGWLITGMIISFFFSGCGPQESVYTQTNTINIVVTNIAESEYPEVLLSYPTNGQILGTVHELKGHVLDDGVSSRVYVQTPFGWVVLQNVTNYWQLVVTNTKLGQASYQAFAIDDTGQSSLTDTINVWISNTVPSVLLNWGSGFSTNTSILNLGVQASVNTSDFITNLKVIVQANGITKTNDLVFGGVASDISAVYPLTLTPNVVNEVQVAAFSDAGTVPGVSAWVLVTVDTAPPIVVLTSPTAGSVQGFQFDLSGTISDNFALGNLFISYSGKTNVISGKSSWSQRIMTAVETTNFVVQVWAEDAVGNRSEIQSLSLQISNIPTVVCGLPDFYRTNQTQLDLNFASSLGGGVLLTNANVEWGTNFVWDYNWDFSTNVSAFQVTKTVTFVNNATNQLRITVLAANGSSVTSTTKQILVDSEPPLFVVTNFFITNDNPKDPTNVIMSGVVYDVFHGTEQVEVWKSGDYRFRDVPVSGDVWGFSQTFNQKGNYTNLYWVSDGLNSLMATNVVRVFNRPILSSYTPSFDTKIGVRDSLIFNFSEKITNAGVTFSPVISFTQTWSNDGKTLIICPTTEFNILTHYGVTLAHFTNTDGIEGRTTNLNFDTALAIPNGSFEYGTFSSGNLIEGSLTNWLAVSGSSLAILSNGVASDGSRSFWWKSLSTTARDEWSEFIPAMVKSNYTVSLKAFEPSANPLAAQVAFQIQYYDSSSNANTNNVSDVSAYVTLTNDDVWDTLTYDFVPPADTAFVRVRFKAKTTATTNSKVGIDNLTLLLK